MFCRIFVYNINTAACNCKHTNIIYNLHYCKEKFVKSNCTQSYVAVIYTLLYRLICNYTIIIFSSLKILYIHLSQSQ